MTLPLAEIAQQRTVRLILTAYYKPAVLRALVDTDDELREIEALEGLTSRRLTTVPDAGIGPGWGHSMIAAAFAYRRKGGNRFNDETRGAWYAGFDHRTALEEVAFHKTRELGYIGHYRDEVQYRALHASFIGRFHDLRNVSPKPACLDADISVGYPEGQALAKSLINGGSRGLVYPSVRDPGGTCIVAFQPNAVQDVTPGANWKISWNGSPVWAATAV
ncbi:MAG TPA: RES family NAD+ phosphorylase [Beijerinckiaceae bacterium]|nr:RES family NAD+ phosphorylase [Beijerinckiaceae bacterium]